MKMAKKQLKDYNKPEYNTQKEQTQLEYVLEMDRLSKQHMMEIGNPVRR